MKILKEIIEDLLIAIGLIFVFGVGAYYDTKVHNELYSATATTETTTEIHYGE